MAAEVLRGGMQHDIGSQREGILEVGGSEGVIHDQVGSPFVGYVGQRRNRRDKKQGVTRGFYPDEFGFGAEGGCDLIGVGRIDKVKRFMMR